MAPPLAATNHSWKEGIIFQIILFSFIPYRADEVNYESQLGDKDYVMYVIFRLGIYVN